MPATTSSSAGGSPSPDTVDLSDVPETALWTLWNRAMDMPRADRLVEDPLAVELVERIDYDFPGHFGRPSAFHPIRARVGDDLIRDYLSRTPEQPVVVGLGEGLDSQLWRVDDNRVRWITVDLPELIEVRQRLLPPIRARRTWPGRCSNRRGWTPSPLARDPSSRPPGC